MLGVGGDRLHGAGDGVVSDVSAAEIVHGGRVHPVGVDAHVRVLRALVGPTHLTTPKKGVVKWVGAHL